VGPRAAPLKSPPTPTTSSRLDDELGPLSKNRLFRSRMRPGALATIAAPLRADVRSLFSQKMLFAASTAWPVPALTTRPSVLNANVLLVTCSLRPAPSMTERPSVLPTMTLLTILGTLDEAPVAIEAMPMPALITKLLRRRTFESVSETPIALGLIGPVAGLP